MTEGKIVILDEHRPKTEEPRRVMVELTIYHNGDGDLWLSDEIAGKEQFNWIFAKIAEISAALVRTKGEITGEV